MSVESEFPLEAFDRHLSDRDAVGVADILCEHEFVLLCLADDSGEPGEDAASVPALTADFEGGRYLVAFTDSDRARQFIRAQRDLFGDQQEVSGYVVSGRELLEFCDEVDGLVLDPESGQTRRLDADWVESIADAMDAA